MQQDYTADDLRTWQIEGRSSVPLRLCPASAGPSAGPWSFCSPPWLTSSTSSVGCSVFGLVRSAVGQFQVLVHQPQDKETQKSIFN